MIRMSVGMPTQKLRPSYLYCTRCALIKDHLLTGCMALRKCFFILVELYAAKQLSLLNMILLE